MAKNAKKTVTNPISDWEKQRAKEDAQSDHNNKEMKKAQQNIIDNINYFKKIEGETYRYSNSLTNIKGSVIELLFINGMKDVLASQQYFKELTKYCVSQINHNASK